MQLIYVLVLILITSVRDLIAENYINLRTMRYEDSNNVSIWEGLVLFQTDLSPETQLSVQYGIDSVTSASSISSITSESGSLGTLIAPARNFAVSHDDHDDDDDDDDDGGHAHGEGTHYRNSGSVALTHTFFEHLKSTTSAQFSTKSDYKSYTIGQNVSFPLSSLTTISFGAYYTSNDNNPTVSTTNTYLIPPDRNLDSTQWTGIVTVERLLSPISKLKLILDGFKQEGYLSTGYQYVEIDEGTPTGLSIDSLPDTHTGFGIATVYSRFLGEKSAIHFKTRLFKDSYDITALSEEVRYRTYLSDPLIWEIKGRFYTQTASSYWARSFQTLPDGYFTNHYALSDISSFLIGTGVRYETESFGTINGQIEYYVAEHFDYITLSTGVEFTF